MSSHLRVRCSEIATLILSSNIMQEYFDSLYPNSNWFYLHLHEFDGDDMLRR